MVTAAKLRLCDQNMSVVRRILSMPDPAAEVWQSLSHNQRVVLLMAAGLPDGREDDAWRDFSAEQHVEIIAQIRAFGRIAKHYTAIIKGRDIV